MLPAISIFASILVSQLVGAQNNVRINPNIGQAAILFANQIPFEKQTHSDVLKFSRDDFPKSWDQQFASFSEKYKRPLLDPKKNYILILATEPSHAYDLRSGEHLRRSLTKKAPGLKIHVGHMIVGWQCSDGQQVTEQRVAAITGEEDHQLSRMVFDGWGMTSYLSVFTDGVFQSGRHVDDIFQNKIVPKGIPFQFLILAIKPQQCRRASEFVKAYVSNPDKPYRLFGTPPDPARFQGAGCISFVDAVLNYAGVLNEFRSHFVRHLKIPARTLGKGPINASGQPRNIEHAFVHPALVAAAKGPISLDHLFDMTWDPKGDEQYFAMDQIDPELIQLGFRLINEQALNVIRSRGGQWDLRFQAAVTRTRSIESLNRFINPFAINEIAAFSPELRTELIAPGYDLDSGNQANLMQQSVNDLFRHHGSTMGIEFFNFFNQYGLKLELAGEG